MRSNHDNVKVKAKKGRSENRVAPLYRSARRTIASPKTDVALEPAPKAIRAAVETLYEIAPQFEPIEKMAGPLTVKRLSPEFASLIRIVVGQQLHTKAAASIFGRLQDTVKLSPEGILGVPETTLSKAGLSRPKINTCLALANAVASKRLNIAKLKTLEDDGAREKLVAIRGIGPWTAEIYLLFCLGRMDAWPHSDLGLQLAYQSLRRLPEKPDTRALLAIGEDFRPVRGAAAYLLWHYYRHVKGR
jgi:DNA-3-methyladenine glycosylase II